jgi:multidrug efflux system outer membrane protein
LKPCFIKIIPFVLVAVLTGACTMGPDFEPPGPGVAIPESFINAPAEQIAPFAASDPWWRVFKDPAIDQVVSQVLKNNPDIRTAAARVLEAQSVFRQTRADQFPVAGINGEAGRQSYSAFNPLTGTSGTNTSDSYSLSLPASYEIDLWGRLSRATEAARAELLSAQENRRTVVPSLVAEAVTLYLSIESLERQIQVTEQSIDAYRLSLDIVEGRYRRGLTSILDVRQAIRSLARAQSQLPALNAALGTQTQAMAVLQGQYPEDKPPRAHGLDYYSQPPMVPPGLPSDLMLRRPDIRAAEAALHAECSRIGVAKASRFPKIALTGRFGYASDELNSLMDPASELWNIAAGVTQPLFDAGKLAAGQRAAEARYEQALAKYSKIVLQAFAEVEGALLTNKEQTDRRNRLLKYREAAAATLDAAADRYARGLVDYLTVLDARLVDIDAELQVIAVEFDILANHVRLCRALGGGWDTAWMADAGQNKQETISTTGKSPFQPKP